jgi:hypothetical protein
MSVHHGRLSASLTLLEEWEVAKAFDQLHESEPDIWFLRRYH